MKLTIKEIAEMAGVSITTVSQILNNKGSRFSQETREKVLAIVEEHHYKPDYFASNLINRHSKTIGMIVPDVTDSFFSKVIEGVENYLHPLGYMILLCNSNHSQAKECQYIEEFVHRSVDGILLATPHILPEKYGVATGAYQGIPMVLIDRGINERKSGRLIIKEYEGAYQALQQLIQRGHRHIGLLKETSGYYQLTERVTAYSHVLKDAGIPYRNEYVCEGELTIAGGYQAAKVLLEQAEITAIFCGNDEMAVGCYQAIHQKGKRVPEDISVVGFDGLEISEYLVPSLTTVRQPILEIGYQAAKFLVEAFDHPKKEMPNKIFETEVIVRGSIGSPNT